MEWPRASAGLLVVALALTGRGVRAEPAGGGSGSSPASPGASGPGGHGHGHGHGGGRMGGGRMSGGDEGLEWWQHGALVYRDELIAAGLASVAALVAGPAVGGRAGTALAASGLAVGLLGGPSIHLWHGLPARASASAALRGGLLLAGAGVGTWISAGGGSCAGLSICVPRATALGAGVGLVLAMAVDATFFGRVPEREAPLPFARQAPEIGAALLASAAGPSVGVAGRF